MEIDECQKGRVHVTRIVVPRTQGVKADDQEIRVVQRKLFAVPTGVLVESRTGKSAFQSRDKAVTTVFICDLHMPGGPITEGVKRLR